MGLIQADEIASTALFLASDDSKRITGHLMMVDSGATAW
jgi:enoyl-[acyl-carrier-protein] reductase (NADH)